MTKMYMFSSARKMMSALVELPGGGHRLYVKGASEMIVSKAVRANVNGSEAPLTDALQGELADQILAMANRALRTIGIAHRDFASLDGVDLEQPLEQLGELTLDAIVGIIDPLRGDVKAAVAQCQAAGIMVRMVTGDNINTAKAIARDCGILTEGGTCLEGPTFREC